MTIKKIKQDGKVTIEIHISFDIFHRLTKAIKKLKCKK